MVTAKDQHRATRANPKPVKKRNRPLTGKGTGVRKTAGAYRYHVWYGVPADVSHEDYVSITNLSDRATLATVKRNCQELGCRALLQDAAGSTRGWVHSDGSYTLA